MSAIIFSKLHKKQIGFTLFELVLVVLLVGVFMTFAIDRMLRIQIDAERVSIQNVIAALKSAIALQGAELAVNSGVNSISTLEDTNPINYLQEQPYNYLGLKNDNQAGQYPDASWYYDPSQNILVYKVKNTNYFVTGLPGVPRIRLKVETIYMDEASRRENTNVRGVSIKSLDNYFWKVD